ncbi:MAG TPA: hypothetical protein VEJ63_15480, partial [Planctomycetota bacterium]|nr:hypothetical protein [Planctomycetota bacterium]
PTVFTGAIVRNVKAPEKPLFVRLAKNRTLPLCLPSGKYIVALEPIAELKAGSAYLSGPGSTISGGEFEVVAWKRNQKHVLKLGKAELIELSLMGGDDKMTHDKAAFEVRCPEKFEYSIDVLAVAPNSFSPDENVRIWTNKLKGSAIVQYNIDKNASEELKAGKEYIVRVNWVNPLTKETITGGVERRFKVK